MGITHAHHALGSCQSLLLPWASHVIVAPICMLQLSGTGTFWCPAGLEQDVKSLHEGAGRSAHVPAGGEDGSDDVPVEEGQHVMLSYEWWVHGGITRHSKASLDMTCQRVQALPLRKLSMLLCPCLESLSRTNKITARKWLRDCSLCTPLHNQFMTQPCQHCLRHILQGLPAECDADQE
jgi:hypothetical protein